MKIRTVSYPWDWIRDTAIIDIVNVLKNKEYFDVSTWDCFANMAWKMPHDYNDDSHNKSELQFEGGNVLEKYKRRFKRFFDHIYDDVPTFLLRFGNDDGIEGLQRLLPNSCKVLYIQDGHPDSIVTHTAIKTFIGETIDPYGQIVLCIVEQLEKHLLHFPIKREVILDIINTYDTHLDFYGGLVFSHEIKEFDTESSFLQYTFTQLKTITGIEYALL
jgi:hypothetical protein